MAVALLRRLDIPDTALKIAQDAYAKSPDYYSANAMASAYRSANRPHDAIAMYEAALQHNPDEISVMLDVADLYTEIGKMPDAIAWYGKVVAREPEHEWALPSLYAAQYTATGDKSWQDKLDAYSEAHPENERARILSGQFHPYFGGHLPDPPDAVINVMRQFMRSVAGQADPSKPASINISISALEAPSAILAANLEIKRYSPEGVVGITVDEIQQPDPRLPRVPVDLQLWKYDGVYASPAVPPPSPEIAETVEFVACQPYNLKIWLELAKEAASRLTPDDAEGIAAAMVHPPSVPEGMRAWTWLQRVQFAAALILSRLDTGWIGSIRRKALIDLANGPNDWSVGAAAVALAAIAQTESDARAEIVQLYRDILKNTPTSGYTCYVEPVITSYLAVPEISPGEREQLEGLLAKLQQNDSAMQPASETEDDEPGYAPGDE
jgi:tetratricopeptide (TPR) repeat protein